MSYCRWSTDDFQSDLYCYESSEGYETHVAKRRYVPAEPLPEPVPWEHSDEYLKRHAKVNEIIGRSETVVIGLPYDGQSFTDDTLKELLARLLMLREAGYRFPDCVIESVREEITQESQA